jgi:cellulose synthase/poly-beta-1,6-N-acetylglucosamine synthase-like glycosyltransferase
MKPIEEFPLKYSSDLKLLSIPTDEELHDICTQIKGRVENLITPIHPEVSVIFPAYNEEMYLPLMLWTLSKLDTKVPIEIIGVNNASTDRT